VLAALSLMSFLTVLWTRISEARHPAPLSPLPLVAAGVSAACIAVGGVVMASISGSMLGTSSPMPSADLLRFSNGLGFALVGVAGMLAAALPVAHLSLLARFAGVFGRKLTVFGLAVAVVLLGAIAFVPIVALLIWLVIASITLLRRPPQRIERRSPEKMVCRRAIFSGLPARSRAGSSLRRCGGTCGRRAARTR
jgi:hypothetical protein